MSSCTDKNAIFEDETALIPGMIATLVWEEACRFLDADLPKGWIPQLARKAKTIYSHNLRFRAVLRRPGCSGRDSLYAFMRHWLAALLLKYDATLFHRLPDSYTTGRELPLEALTAGPSPIPSRRCRIRRTVT